MSASVRIFRNGSVSPEMRGTIRALRVCAIPTCCPWPLNLAEEPHPPSVWAPWSERRLEDSLQQNHRLCQCLPGTTWEEGLSSVTHRCPGPLVVSDDETETTRVTDTSAILLWSLSFRTHKNQYEEVFSDPTLLLWGFQKELISGQGWADQWHSALGLHGDGDIPSYAAHYENISIPWVIAEHAKAVWPKRWLLHCI